MEKKVIPSSSDLRSFFQGICMGIAEAVPGVNGATIAILFGIYTRIIDAIQQLTPTCLIKIATNFLLSWRLSNRRQFCFYVQEMQLRFLFSIAIGSLFSIWILSGFIPKFATSYPAPFHAFVFGVVAVSAYIPLSQIEKIQLRHLFLMGFCSVLTFMLVGSPNMTSSHQWIFFYGVIGACALLLPGLSGSYLLQIFGQYEYLLENLHQAFAFDASALAVVGLFGLGMFTGMILFAKLLSWLLHHYQSAVMSILTGLVIGALRTLWPSEIAKSVFTATPLIGLMFLGGLLMAFLIKQEQRLKK